MSTPKRKKLQRQKEHQRQKILKQQEQTLKINNSVQSKKEMKSYAKLPANYRETPSYPSVTKVGAISNNKPESMQYTGDYITGIATMHKSNLVPVSRGIDPREYATMRRN